MICPACGSSMQCRVKDSREYDTYVSRKRECMICGYKYLTHEKFVRGCKSVNGPRILYMNELKDNRDAVWLELRTGKVLATSIAEVTDNAVYFDSGINLDRNTYLKMWRIWNKRPDDIRRKEEQWHLA